LPECILISISSIIYKNTYFLSCSGDHWGLWQINKLYAFSQRPKILTAFCLYTEKTQSSRTSSCIYLYSQPKWNHLVCWP